MENPFDSQQCQRGEFPVGESIAPSPERKVVVDWPDSCVEPQNSSCHWPQRRVSVLKVIPVLKGGKGLLFPLGSSKTYLYFPKYSPAPTPTMENVG